MKTEAVFSSIRQTALHLLSVIVLMFGVYATGQTLLNLFAYDHYPISQAITSRSLFSSPINVGFPEDESQCPEFTGGIFSGMSEQELARRDENIQSCKNRIQQKQNQLKNADITHSILLLGIGIGLYVASKPKVKVLQTTSD